MTEYFDQKTLKITQKHNAAIESDTIYCFENFNIIYQQKPSVLNSIRTLIFSNLITMQILNTLGLPMPTTNKFHVKLRACTLKSCSR